MMIVYLILIGALILGLFIGSTGIACISLGMMAVIGVYMFIAGKRKLSPEEKEFIREKGDVSGG